jgi:hypothetical protein
VIWRLLICGAAGTVDSWVQPSLSTDERVVPSLSIAAFALTIRAATSGAIEKACDWPFRNRIEGKEVSAFERAFRAVSSVECPTFCKAFGSQEEIVPLRVSSLRMAFWLQIQLAVERRKVLNKDQPRILIESDSWAIGPVSTTIGINGGFVQELQIAITAPKLRWHSQGRAKESSKRLTAVAHSASFVRSFISRTRHVSLLATLGMLCVSGTMTLGQESTSIAKQAQNPIANLISVPLENDFDPQTGYKNEDSYVLEMKPVVPFRLSNDWNLITRTVIPIIQVPDLTPNVSGVSGLGDVELSLFFSPAKAGPIIWGAGPAISIPTATQDILGTKKLSVGPAVVVLRSQGHWLFGTLIQNLFSVAGPSERPDVNQMLIQPFVNYNLRHGWYLTSSPIITANWEATPANTWTVPVGGGVGKIVHFGKLPVSVYTQFFRNTSFPESTSHWSARFEMTFLFPKER